MTLCLKQGGSMNSFSLVKTLRDKLEVESQFDDQDLSVALSGNDREATALVTLMVDGEKKQFIIKAESLQFKSVS